MRDEAIKASPTRVAAEALGKKLSGDIGVTKSIPGAPVETGSHDSAPADTKR